MKHGNFGRLAGRLPVRFAGLAILLALGIVFWSACGAAGDGGAPQHVSAGSGGADSSAAAGETTPGTDAAETGSPPSEDQAGEPENGADDVDRTPAVGVDPSSPGAGAEADAAERETQEAASGSGDTASGSGGTLSGSGSTPASRPADNGSAADAPGASTRDDEERPQQEGDASSNAGGQAAEPVSEPEAPSVALTIRGEGDIGIILEDYSMSLNEGDTVLELTKRAARQENIPMEYRGRGALAYVEGINDLYEFDHGPESGWLYYVNGNQPVEGAGVYKPAPGDKIEWVYVLEKKND